jgi:hypothetical protein
MGVTFNAQIESITESMTPPKQAPPSVVDEERTPEMKPRVVAPPELTRQCAFARPCAQPALETEWLEVCVYAGCIATVIFAGYTLGYRHALENTLSNVLADIA